MDRSALARATEGTEAPTPGYLYVDLSKGAAANPSVCHDMAVYLTRRLATKQNPNIKYKCCKVIAKLCDSVPRNQFRRSVAQDPSAVGAIKEALNFRGSMDAVRGDEPNQKVRVAAKEALDAVYREAPSSETTTSGGISSSYAPSPHGGGGYSGGGGSTGGGIGPRRMEGVGNPMFNDPRNDPKYNGQQPSNFREAVKEAGDVIVGMIKDPLARGVEIPAGGLPQNTNVPRQGHSGDLPGYNRSAHNQTYGRPPPGASELMRQTGGQWTMASNRGPGAIQHRPDAESEYYKSRDTSFQWANNGANKTHAGASTGTVGGSWASPAAAASAPNHGMQGPVNPTTASLPPAGQTGAAQSDGSYEKSLVMELCPPGGMKPVPPPDKLAHFARAVPNLNSDLICPIVLDCLEDGQPWIIRAKALCVMETCIQHGTNAATGTNAYRDFFHACQEEIVPLANHPRAAIHDPARRVLTLLGVVNSGAATNAAATAAPVPNLLDFDNETEAPAPAAPAPAPVAAGSMFGGMQVKSASAGSAPPVAAPPVAAPPVAAPPAAAASADLLGDFTAPVAESASTAAAPSAPPTDMFAQLAVKSTDAADASAAPQETDAVAAAPPAGGSAFGFINSDAPAAAAGNEPKSFDPLKNVTPQATQRKMMQMSPEQMQAMAYQQNMWMQQQQQMAMAMAMQQQRGAAGGGPVMMMPMFPTMQHPPQQQMPGMPNGAAAMSFQNARPARQDDKKFDFVKDAMQNAK